MSATLTQAATFLIVEDELLQQRFHKRLIEGMGYRCVGQAASADEAEEQAKANPPDLVVVDLLLEGDRTGHDLVSSLRQSRPGLPVLYLTGNTDLLLRIAKDDPGPSRYLVKPPDLNELKAALLELMNPG